LTPIAVCSDFCPGRYDLPLAPFGDGKLITAVGALCPNERASNASPWHFCLVQAKDEDLRDFRNAKAMAQALRAALAAKDLKITISQSLELVAEFGVADWNTLAAKISHGERPMAREKVSSLPLPTVASISVPPLSATLEATPDRALVFATGCFRNDERLQRRSWRAN
jgi:hypothetical protein